MSRLTCLYFESAVSQHPASPLLPVPSFPQLHVSTLAGQFLPLKSCFYDSQASAVFCSTLFGSLDLRQAQKKWLYRRGFSSFESLNTRSPFDWKWTVDCHHEKQEQLRGETGQLCPDGAANYPQTPGEGLITYFYLCLTHFKVELKAVFSLKRPLLGTCRQVK